MKDIIRVKDDYYISAHFSFAEEKARVLKSGEMFAVFNQDGHIRPLGFENHGLYYQGTRYISRLVYSIGGHYPLLLSSEVEEGDGLLVVDLTNADFTGRNNEFNQKGKVHFLRSCFLKEPSYYERISVSNYGLSPMSLAFGLEFEADFRDIFEARGLSRGRRGTMLDAVYSRRSLELGYKGLDDIFRKTVLSFDPVPLTIKKNRADYLVRLEPKQHRDFYIRFDCLDNRKKNVVQVFSEAHEDIRKTNRRLRRDCCQIETSNSQFNRWLQRSIDDVFVMMTKVGDEYYPYAGIPWFSTVFGRDGIITALETLWIYPEIARGVLLHLSRTQAKEFNLNIDAEPGKIMHESRKGEMANLGEIPFGCYYGSVDSTPLFLILAGYYYSRTGDADLIRRIWPSLLSGLNWINEYGDSDGDGFVEYDRKAIGGLSQQGWKDSGDSVFYKDGTIAEPPIALCEVQGYVYEAKKQMSELARVLKDHELSQVLLADAEQLKKDFKSFFWQKDMDFPALALDGKKNPCKVMSSNAGQCLFSGIISRAMASRVRERLMEEEFFSGWGIRTLANTEQRFNPMSYHNGSVWPHDNALIAYGFDRFGYKDSVLKIMQGLFDASQSMDLYRLPELFCGFSRRNSQGPTLYPVACNPQAWSSACIFMLIQSCLGLRIDACEKKIYFSYPLLPEYLKEVRIRNLKIDSSVIDINIEYNMKAATIKVIGRTGGIKVVSMK